MARLANKVALVIGGASGIGYAIARRFAEEGATTWLTGRRAAEVQAAAARIAGETRPVQADPDQQADLDALVARLRDESGHLDTLVVNAGMSEPALLGDISREHFDRHFGLNVRALLFSVQTALPLMRRGSTIVLIGSIAGDSGIAAYSVYAATKAAVRALARSWTAELAPRGIRVNVVSPGPTHTAMMAAVSDDIHAALSARIPLGRLGQPEEVAAAALFLASDESSYTAGAELSVDGGMAQV